MESLQTVIASLRREILAALAEPCDLPACARLEAERVSATLRFVVQSEMSPGGAVGVQFGVVPQSTAEAMAHTVTIDFKVAAGAPADPASAVPAPVTLALQDPEKLNETAARELEDALASVLGVPGFDSSARATVFREALEELSEEQARALSEVFRGAQSPESSPATTHAGHLLNRLLATAPAGPERGRALLATLLQQHSVRLLEPFVMKRWKTQMDWLDEPLQS